MKRALFGFALIASLAVEGADLTKADIEKLMSELSNWGRWGKADEIGTVNLITACEAQRSGGAREGRLCGHAGS